MREAKTTGKRAQILEAATRIFAEKGFLSSTVAEIAREARVADGTIYLYFRSKDDLLLRLVEARMGELGAQMEAELARHGSSTERLAAFIRFHLQQVAARPEEAQVLIVELRQSGSKLKEALASFMRPYLGLLSAVLEEGIADGSFRAIDPRPVRHAIFGALDEVALAWLLRGRRFDLEENARQLADLFVRGLVDDVREQRSTP